MHGTVPKFVNRIVSNVEFWKTLTDKEWLLEMIEFGMKIPFEIPPPPLKLRNNTMAIDPENVEWVRNTIREYVDCKIIEPVDYLPYCVSPL
jgi:hypothetical protein